MNHYDIIPIPNAIPFTVAEGVIFIVAAAWYIRDCARYPHAGRILGVLPLFFAWRSL
jgi:hypothetical protein